MGPGQRTQRRAVSIKLARPGVCRVGLARGVHNAVLVLYWTRRLSTWLTSCCRCCQTGKMSLQAHIAGAKLERLVKERVWMALTHSHPSAASSCEVGTFASPGSAKTQLPAGLERVEATEDNRAKRVRIADC